MASLKQGWDVTNSDMKELSFFWLYTCMGINTYVRSKEFKLLEGGTIIKIKMKISNYNFQNFLPKLFENLKK